VVGKLICVSRDTRHSDLIAKGQSDIGHLAGKHRRLDRPTNTNTTESGGRRRSPYASRGSGIAERLESARIPALFV